jgi:hypothetical protein
MPPESTSTDFTLTGPHAQTGGLVLSSSYPPNATLLVGAPPKTTSSSGYSPPASKADRTAGTRSRWAGVSLSSDSRIRRVTGAAWAATGAGSGTRELNAWLACWFCPAPAETHPDGAATPGTCGQ